MFTRLCRPNQAQVGLATPLSQVLTDGRPQKKTKTERTIQGIQPMKAEPKPWDLWTTCGVSRSSGKRQVLFGCQTLRKR